MFGGTVLGRLLIWGFALSFLGVARAQTNDHSSLRHNARKVLTKLDHVADQLSTRDADHIRRLLEEIDWTLSNYQDPVRRQLLCVSNGDTGGFEKFGVYDAAKRAIVGGYTSKANCQSVIAGQNVDLICVSNGDTGGFEKFTIYDLNIQENIGGSTSLSKCQNVVSKANRLFVCASNGDTGGFEKFQIFDRSHGQSVGGPTSLENCLAAISH